MNLFLFSKSNWNILNFRYHLINELNKNNFRIFTISQKDKYHSKLKKIAYRLININYKNRNITFVNDMINFIFIIYYVYKYRPSVFVSFNIKPIILSGFISKIFRITNVITITGLGTVFEERTSLIIKKIAIYLYSKSIKKKDYIIFQNENDLQFFLKNKIINHNHNYFIVGGSGVNINYFKYKKINFNKKTNFTYIGRLLKSKGIDTFIETIDKYFSNNNLIEFSIIGNYENKKDFNYKLFKKLKDNKIIKYYNHQNNIKNYIYNSECIVLPSYREGTSKVLLESMSCGRPIITTNVPGCNYLTNNNKNGFLCEKNNIKSLKKSIISFINLSDKEKNQLSLNSREFITKNFDEKNIIERYISIVNKIK